MHVRAIAAWWGYAEGNRTLVGLVVLVVVVAAVAFVARKWWRR
jgi:uncharacterized membrane protein